MSSINNPNKNTTIIMVAHRLNTVKNDIIFSFEKGQLINQGKFDEIMKNNQVIFKLIFNKLTK